MTGYGTASGTGEGLQVVAELHSVNQRALQVVVNGPREWGGLEAEIAAVLREKVARGKFTANLRVVRTSPDGGETPDWEEVDRRVGLLRRTMERHGAEGGIGADTLYRILCDSQREGAGPQWESARETVLATLARALEGLREMRAAEGARLRREFEDRIRALRAHLDSIRALDRDRIPDHRDQLLARLRQMDLDLDPGDERVAREVAFLADRSDISEETARIRSHLVALEEAVAAAGPVGRRIEFVLQELHREFNTVGSKTTTSALAAVVIEAKQELEKLREQAANIE
ncbi:MAG: YicC family protein [Puniceicoccaceae bacterium]